MQGTAKSASTVKRKVLRIYSFFTKNVRRTFLSIMLFSILIPYAIITIFSFSRLIKQSKEDFSRNNRQLSGNAATYFGAYLRSIDQVGLELYSDIVLSNYLQRGITTFITESEQHRYTEERIRSFYYQINDACLSRYASADHAVEATYGVTRWHACSYISNLQYTPYQQIHESVDDFPDDDTRISFYCFGENNTQYLAYTRAVQFLTSEEINGFLTLVINPAKLIDTARSFLGSENDSLFIYSDTEKQMILGAGNTDISEEVSTVLSDNEAISEETPERMTLGGQPSLLYRYPIKDCGVTLCWITSAKMNLSGITGTLWYTALLLGIVFLASLLLMIWLSKSVTHSVDQLITKQVENAAAMQQMEYRTLQATMNPHFIANTLQPIGKMALDHNAYDVKYMLDSFCDIVRYSLKGSEPDATIKSEMTHLEKYLLMQKLRLGDHFDYSVSYAPETASFLIPRMTLQPLAENVICYGFDEQTTEVRLDAAAYFDHNCLILEITDNGAGFKCDLNQLEEELKGSSVPKKDQITGIGLSHVNSRLRLQFGDRYTIHITSVPTKNTSVQIRIRMEDES